MSGLVTVVVGGQWGSESKGNACKHFAHRDHQTGQPHVAVRVGGSQAGHTVYDPEGREWKLRHVPVAAVVNPDAMLVIAAGSEIDVEVLAGEIRDIEAAGYPVTERLYIHPQATIIDQVHKDHEAGANLTGRLGSTAKGVGAARASRAMRTARLWRDLDETPDCQVLTDDILNFTLANNAHVVVEGVQGFGLGTHAGEYPFCTSSDARAIDFLAMAGISPWASEVERVEVLIVLRVRPIRVAGNSGPLRGETSWTELGLPEEHTTVTQKVRRVGEWDEGLARRAIAANGGPGPNVSIYLSMLDQLDPTVVQMDASEIFDGRAGYEDAKEFIGCVNGLARVSLISTGPDRISEMPFGSHGISWNSED